MGKQIPSTLLHAFVWSFHVSASCMWLAEDYPAFYISRFQLIINFSQNKLFILWILSANLHLFLSLSNSWTKGSKEHVGEQ